MQSGCADRFCSDPLLLDEARAPAPLPPRPPPARARPPLPPAAAPRAGCPRRMAAFLLDTGVALGTFLGTVTPLSLALPSDQAWWVAMVTTATAAFVNEVVLTGLRGASFGKAAVGIRVADHRGEAPGLIRAFLREVPGKFLSQTPWGLGFALAAIDPEGRALHDRLSGTWVVEADHQGPPRRARLAPGHRRRRLAAGDDGPLEAAEASEVDRAA